MADKLTSCFDIDTPHGDAKITNTTLRNSNSLFGPIYYYKSSYSDPFTGEGADDKQLYLILENVTIINSQSFYASAIVFNKSLYISNTIVTCDQRHTIWKSKNIFNENQQEESRRGLQYAEKEFSFEPDFESFTPPSTLVFFYGIGQVYVNNITISDCLFQLDLDGLYSMNTQQHSTKKTLFIDSNSNYKNITVLKNYMYTLLFAATYIYNVTLEDFKFDQSIIKSDQSFNFIQNISISNHYCLSDGGIIFIQEYVDIEIGYSQIQIVNSTFQNIQVQGAGGIIFSPFIVDYIIFDRVIIKNITSKYQGGLFFFNSTSEDYFNLKIINSYITDFKSLDKGQFLFATLKNFKLEISETTIECSSTLTEIQSELSESQSIGAIYIQNSIQGLFTKHSIFRQCRESKDGSLITLENTYFEDYESKFENNLASYGGAITCNFCRMKMTKTQFINNIASQGGCIFTDQTVNLHFLQISVLNNTAYRDGGFIFLRLNNQETKSLSKSGSFLYSIAEQLTMNITNSIFQCSTTETEANKTVQLNDRYFAADTDTQFSITNAAQVNSINNIYKFCGPTSYGGQYTLTKTKFFDQKSQYLFNTGFYGGQIPWKSRKGGWSIPSCIIFKSYINIL
ncbi:UNKNOWN [Stylonychia lemnae]|uniref:Right handed beta helix domain-containing protein n=1 Tax=Stylonychia lemnae TaxID=5949 RepID=A0A078AN46_STYLE|nr:UNKNOWN [Stylonychia lemnae]|eukprot:CDW82328.1 UNKNOWN [Stylonychia lemnae]